MTQNPSVSFANHPYASFLHNVEKPARYVGGEWGQIQKNWDDTHIRVCLAFPDIFDIGMSHLGTRILYHELNQPSDMLCERAFVPWKDMEQALRERSMSIVSLENAKPLHAFHVVGISLQHELVFTNVLTLLDLGGIPLRASARGENDPLVLGGGSVASHPEPMAPFFDAFVLGDGERKAVEVARCWVNDIDKGLPRAERLRNLAALGGVYVPSLYTRHIDEASKRMVVDSTVGCDAPLPVVRAFVPVLDPFPTQFPVGGPEAVFDRLSVEIARGCSQGCRFCQAGMIFRPERERSAESLVDTVVQSLANSGQDDVSLTSLSPADHSAIGKLVSCIAERPELENVALNVSSLRAYGLDTGTLDEIRRVRVSNLTFAPEAGTQRLRDVINKNVTKEQLLESTLRVVERGWERIKLYFMIGLPTETSEDIDALVDLTERVRVVAKAMRVRGRPVQITASASTFVPKPHTPFQWAQMVDLPTVNDKQRCLMQRARERKVEMKTHEPHGSVLEGILSRGDWRLAEVIEDAWRAGSRFDAWDGNVRWSNWLEAMARHGLVVDDYLQAMPVEGRLPWDHLNMGVRPEFLRREWERALRPVTSLPCLRPVNADSRKLVCNQCGLDCVLDRDSAQNETENVTSTEAMLSDDRKRFPVFEDDPVSYRLCYEKMGRSSLLGHLDLVREMPRILRRAGLPLAYSHGFHPKAIMAFGPALQLGVPSFEEYVDIKTVVSVEMGETLRRINAACPLGIRFTAITSLPTRSKPVVNQVCEAEMLMAIPFETVAARGGKDWLQEKIDGIVSAKTLTVKRVSKDKEKTIDMRQLILDMRLAGQEDESCLHAAGIPGQWVGLRLRCVIGAKGTVRLDDVAALLGDGESVPYRAVRLTLRARDGASVMGASVVEAGVAQPADG